MIPTPEITDITEDTEDLNDEDRFYRSEKGTFVKIKTREVASEDPHVFIAIMTASLCDASGKAVAHPTMPDKKHITHPRQVQVHSSTPTASLVDMVTEGHHILVKEVETAEMNRIQAKALKGIALIGSPKQLLLSAPK